jgi:hypothetical protein
MKRGKKLGDFLIDKSARRGRKNVGPSVETCCGATLSIHVMGR